MSIFYFILMSLAVWRVTYALVYQVGPNRIIENARNGVINYPWSPLHCFKCTSVWVALAFSLFTPLEWFLVVWLAASTVAIVIEAVINLLDTEPLITHTEDKNGLQV